MKVYAIIADDRVESLTRTLFTQAVESMVRRGHTVHVLDLYEYAAVMPFYRHAVVRDGKRKEPLEQSEFYRSNREQVMAADRLLISFPTYWYGVPGILKCWIDLINNFAWNYEGGRRARSKHKIEKALVISTMMQKRRLLWHQLACRQVRNTLLWMGVPKVLCYEVGESFELIGDEVEQHQEGVVAMAHKLVAS